MRRAYESPRMSRVEYAGRCCDKVYVVTDAGSTLALSPGDAEWVRVELRWQSSGYGREQ